MEPRDIATVCLCLFAFCILALICSSICCSLSMVSKERMTVIDKMTINNKDSDEIDKLFGHGLPSVTESKLSTSEVSTFGRI